MSDRLRDTLSTLRTDVDHLPLADSSAVRARGTQRTRRQAVGTSLAVVALVAGAVGIGSALTGTNKAETQLPANRTTTPTNSQQSESSAPESPATRVTDVPDSVFMTTDDLAAAGVTGQARVTKGSQLVGIETLNPCLLGSGDAVATGQSAFGTGPTVAASQMVITQLTADGATNQIRAYGADIAGCATREGAPAGIVVTRPNPTPEESALVARLGADGYVYSIENGSTTSWVLGTRTANAGGYFAFDSGTFSLTQVLTATVAARDRMATTYSSS
jgi:hypothetical protein